MALAATMDLDLDLDHLDRIQSSIPVVGKFKPASGFKMEDYQKAGDVRTVLNAISERIDLCASLIMGGNWMMTLN